MSSIVSVVGITDSDELVGTYIHVRNADETNMIILRDLRRESSAETAAKIKEYLSDEYNRQKFTAASDIALLAAVQKKKPIVASLLKNPDLSKKTLQIAARTAALHQDFKTVVAILAHPNYASRV